MGRLFSAMPKELQHDQKPARHVLFNRAFRQPEALGHLALGQAMDPAQDENIAHLAGQIGDPVRQPGKFVAVDGQALGRRLIADDFQIIEVGHRRDRYHLHAPHVIDHHRARNL